MKGISIVFAAALAMAASFAARAADDDHGHGHSSAAAAAASAPEPSKGSASAGPYAQGQVTRVDKATGRMTVKHGPIPNLEMPPMTMVFRVKDPKFLDEVKPGDKIEFRVEKANGALTITELKPSR